MTSDFYFPLFPPFSSVVKISNLGHQGKKWLLFSNPKQIFKILPNAVFSTEVRSPQVVTESPGGVSGPGGKAEVQSPAPV